MVFFVGKGACIGKKPESDGDPYCRRSPPVIIREYRLCSRRRWGKDVYGGLRLLYNHTGAPLRPVLAKSKTQAWTEDLDFLLSPWFMESAWAVNPRYVYCYGITWPLLFFGLAQRQTPLLTMFVYIRYFFLPWTLISAPPPPLPFLPF